VCRPAAPVSTRSPPKSRTLFVVGSTVTCAPKRCPGVPFDVPGVSLTALTCVQALPSKVHMSEKRCRRPSEVRRPRPPYITVFFRFGSYHIDASAREGGGFFFATCVQSVPSH